MAAEQYKEIVRRWVEEGWNTGNLALVDEMYAADYVLHGNGENTSGREAFKQFVVAYRTAFPDMHLTIEEMIVEGDHVVWRFTARGTHAGPLPGLPPTGRSMTITGIILTRFAGGLWAEDYGNWDMLGMLQQLGAIPLAA